MWSLLSQRCFASLKWIQALEIANAAVQRRNNDVRLLEALTDVLLAKEDYAAARDAVRRAIEQEANSAELM